MTAGIQGGGALPQHNTVTEGGIVSTFKTLKSQGMTDSEAIKYMESTLSPSELAVLKNLGDELPNEPGKPVISKALAHLLMESNKDIQLGKNPWLNPAFMTSFGAVMMDIVRIKSQCRFSESKAAMTNMIMQLQTQLAAAGLTRAAANAEAAIKTTEATFAFVQAGIHAAGGLTSLGTRALATRNVNSRERTLNSKLEKLEAKAKLNHDVDLFKKNAAIRANNRLMPQSPKGYTKTPPADYIKNMRRPLPPTPYTANMKKPLIYTAEVHVGQPQLPQTLQVGHSQLQAVEHKKQTLDFNRYKISRQYDAAKKYEALEKKFVDSKNYEASQKHDIASQNWQNKSNALLAEKKELVQNTPVPENDVTGLPRRTNAEDKDNPQRVSGLKYLTDDKDKKAYNQLHAEYSSLHDPAARGQHIQSEIQILDGARNSAFQTMGSIVDGASKMSVAPLIIQKGDIEGKAQELNAFAKVFEHLERNSSQGAQTAASDIDAILKAFDQILAANSRAHSLARN